MKFNPDKSSRTRRRSLRSCRKREESSSALTKSNCPSSAIRSTPSLSRLSNTRSGPESHTLAVILAHDARDEWSGALAQRPIRIFPSVVTATHRCREAHDNPETRASGMRERIHALVPPVGRADATSPPGIPNPVQKAFPVQESASSPPALSGVSAFPAWSTAMQNERDGHETAVNAAWQNTEISAPRDHCRPTR